jgi:hypothetical protein
MPGSTFHPPPLPHPSPFHPHLACIPSAPCVSLSLTVLCWLYLRIITLNPPAGVLTKLDMMDRGTDWYLCILI